MCGCGSWTVKKAECRRMDAFELWCWTRLLRVPWTARRSNQSILKEISTEYSLEGLILKLKLQYFGHLVWRADSLEKTLMLGKIEGRRRRVQQRMRWLDDITNQWTWVWVSSRSWWWTGKSGVLQSTGSQSDTTELLNWTESNWSHEPQPCLTQWNYEPCHVGPPKMDGSWWRVLTNCGPLEKGMANHFSILALRTPWTVWKGKSNGVD